MTEQTRTRIPAPLYAAAGAGEFAYEQLRKLPALYAATVRAAASSRTELRDKTVSGTTELRERLLASTAELRERALAGTVELRDKTAATVKAANTTAAEFRERAAARRTHDLDADRLRELAKRNTAAFLAGAHAAQDRAVAAYTELIARGERVIGGGIIEAADTVNADIETTEAELEAEQPAERPAGRPGAAKATKAPAKATRPAKRTRAAGGSTR
jgi:heparin binding hemagglutinin HbhA